MTKCHALCPVCYFDSSQKKKKKGSYYYSTLHSGKPRFREIKILPRLKSESGQVWFTFLFIRKETELPCIFNIYCGYRSYNQWIIYAAPIIMLSDERDTKWNNTLL